IPYKVLFCQDFIVHIFGMYTYLRRRLPVGRKEKQIAGPLTLGAKLRHARQMANISLGEMAVSLDYTKSYLSAVENGMGRVSSELIEKYAQRLGLTVEEL